MAQLVAILAGMENRMENNMEGMSKNMDAHTQTMREEMRCMGAGLQKGLEGVKKGNGEILRATCWATEERRRVEVTEEVTVTETCTREIKHVEVTEYTETR